MAQRTESVVPARLGTTVLARFRIEDVDTREGECRRIQERRPYRRTGQSALPAVAGDTSDLVGTNLVEKGRTRPGRSAEPASWPT